MRALMVAVVLILGLMAGMQITLAIAELAGRAIP